MSWMVEILAVGVDKPREQAIKLQYMTEERDEMKASSKTGTVAALFRIEYGKDTKFRALPPKWKEL